MKAISVRMPFPALIMAGIKDLESRTWDTKFRGDLLICAGKTPHKLFREYDHTTNMLSLDNHYAESHYQVAEEFMLLGGKACCVVNVVNVRFMYLSDMERACCDWEPDVYVWELKDIRPIEPFDVHGRLNFFEVDDSLIKYL
mgnify:CR=1 FL=1